MSFKKLKEIDDKITPRLVEKDLLIPAFFLLCVFIEAPGLYFLDKYAKKQEKTKQEETTKVTETKNTPTTYQTWYDVVTNQGR